SIRLRGGAVVAGGTARGGGGVGAPAGAAASGGIDGDVVREPVRPVRGGARIRTRSADGMVAAVLLAQQPVQGDDLPGAAAGGVCGDGPVRLSRPGTVGDDL